MFSAWVCASSGVAAYFDAACLATSTDLTCALTITGADFLGNGLRVGGVVGHTSSGGGYPVLGEQFLRLVFEEIHSAHCLVGLPACGCNAAISDSKPALSRGIHHLRHLCATDHSVGRTSGPSATAARTVTTQASRRLPIFRFTIET